MANDKKFEVKNGLVAQNVEFTSPNRANTLIASMTNGSNVLSFAGTIDAQRILSNGSPVGGGGGPSTDTLANVTARGNVTGDTITITNAGNSLVASGNIQTVGNVVITTGNLFAHKFVDIGNVSYFVEPVASNSVIVAGNVYTNQRIGFMNVNTTVSVVYQYYNANTRSLDTVFG